MDRHWVVGRYEIALLCFGPTCRGHLSLEVDHVFRSRGSIRPVHQPEDSRHIRLKSRLLFGEGRDQVVISVRQPKPSLTEVERVSGGVLQINVDPAIKYRVLEIGVTASPHQGG